MGYDCFVNHPRANWLVLKKSSSMLVTFKAPLVLGRVPSDDDFYYRSLVNGSQVSGGAYTCELGGVFAYVYA